MIKKKLKMNRGFSLLETVFYISFFAVLSILVINALMVMTRSFKETTIKAELAEGGNILERISREVRKADSISSISLNDLKLNTKDNAGADKIIEFVLTGSDVRFLENNVFTGNLNSSGISVLNLNFSQITTAKSVAVKISLTIKSNYDQASRVVDFYDTVVLRGSY